MNDLALGPVTWGNIREAIVKHGSEEGLAWWQDNREDLEALGTDYVKAALVHGRASDEAIRELAAHNPKFRSLWVAYRKATTQQLEDIQDRQARLLSSIRSATDVAITIVKAATSAVIGL